MSNIKNLSFDEGLESFTINGDSNRILRFNPGDVNIITRYKEVVEKINRISEELPDVKVNADGTPVNEFDTAEEQLRAFNNILREQMDYLFNADFYDVIFNGQSPLCAVGRRQDGGRKLLLEEVMEKLGGLIGEACGQNIDNVNVRVSKYTDGYVPGNRQERRYNNKHNRKYHK